MQWIYIISIASIILFIATFRRFQHTAAWYEQEKKTLQISDEYANELNRRVELMRLHDVKTNQQQRS